MFGIKRGNNQEPTPYATGSDFCRIFEKDMNRLYLLSFLLTAGCSLAEKCFVRSLEDSLKHTRVFREWAQSWARRTIIQNAIRMNRPHPIVNSKSSSTSAGDSFKESTEITEIVQLPAFDRFVFVMSVLEGYSDQECSLLLDSTRSDVNAARTRALQQIGGSARRQHKLVTIRPDEQLSQREQESTLRLEAISHLAASV